MELGEGGGGGKPGERGGAGMPEWCLELCEGGGGALCPGLDEFGGGGGGNVGVEDARCIPCDGGGGKLFDGGGGKGLPTMLGGRFAESVELCLFRAPVL